MAFITLSSLFMTQRTTSLCADCSPPGGHGTCFARPDVRLSAAILNLIQIKNPVANREHCEIRKSKECHFLRQPNFGFALIRNQPHG
jgi:hypothetical protein